MKTAFESKSPAEPLLMSHLSSRSSYRWFCTVLVGGLLVAGCGARATDTDTGTETHWLLACDTDAECGGPTSCLCGVCTVSCAEEDPCPGQAPLCTATSGAECSGSSAAAICTDEEVADRLKKTPAVELLPPLRELAARTVPNTNACDDQGWCWDHPSAPGEEFYGLTADGRYAVGQEGVVFDTTGAYLPRPVNAGALTTAVTHANTLWVGSGAGVWRYERGVWTQETDANVSKLAVDEAGVVWGIGYKTLWQREDKQWSEIPIPTGKDGLELAEVYDLAIANNGAVWLLGGYLSGRFPDGTLFVYEGGNWEEYPSGEQTGPVQFLEGRDVPHVYSRISAQGEPTKVFDPRDGWRVLESSGTESIYSLFWGPDGQLWQSTDSGLSVFGEASNSTPDESQLGPARCAEVVPWDNQRLLCALAGGGLVWLSNDGLELEASPQIGVPEPYAPASFGGLPTSVWAQRSEAWGTSANDVWRAPLEHFDGETWSSQLSKGDEFTAIEIDGTGPDDVWFLGETELRHWDGEGLTPVPLPVAADSQLMALRAASVTDVWVLSASFGTSFLVEVTRFDGNTWQVSHQLETTDGFAARAAFGANPAAGALAGTSADLWAAFGQTVLHFDGQAWSTLWHFETPDPQGVPSVHLLDVVTDGDEVWFLTRRQVLQWQNDGFVERGYFARDFEYLALSDGYVYNFSGAFSRRYAR